MTEKCSNTDLLARVVALEASLKALRELLTERDLRYQERSVAQDRAVQVAMDSSKAAINKAETATEKRLEGLNELRSMANDQARNFARADEMKITHDGIHKRIDDLADLVKQQLAHGGGVKDTIGYIVGAVGVFVGAVVAYFHK